MLHLRMNQVAGFYKQNVWKTPVEEWQFKDGGHRSLLKMSFFQRSF